MTGALRGQLIETARGMAALGLSPGTSGNVSVRLPEGFLITPSGIAYDDMTPGHVPKVLFSGGHEGDYRPSVEAPLHEAIFKARAEAGAIVHAHAPFSVALACLRMDIPAFHYMIAVAGGHNIRCAKYATFGTEQLAQNAIEAMAGRKACLLANHGLICFGGDLDEALALAVEVEALAEQYWRALQIGEPVILSEREMDRVIERFADYGKATNELTGE